MNFYFHNKIEIFYKNKKYTFFNKMLPSVLNKISNLDSYNTHLAIGNGKPSNNQTLNKLTNHLKSYALNTELVQCDISKGSPYLKKSLFLSDYALNGTTITEIGLTDSLDNNPTIFNYISLISDEMPNGLFLENNYQILIHLYLYLKLNNEGSGFFTAGNNPFIKFLLGEGLNGQVFATRGNNTTENILTFREPPAECEKQLCEILVSNTSSNNEFELNLTLTANLLTGKTYEILFMIENEPFARLNTQNINSEIFSNENVTSKPSYVLDLGEDVKQVNTIINSSTNTAETNFFFSKYANCFGDKVSLPFNNLFDSQTPRFVSKDGDKIFFVINDYVYAYKNENFKITKINTSSITVKQITKIISFENFVFVITNEEPFISCYLIENSKMVSFSLELTEKCLNATNNILHVDITISKENILMIAIISALNNHGLTLYFKLNELKTSFVFLDLIESSHNFSYVLALIKNNFCDARVMFVEEGDYSSDCRLVTHFPNQTSEDIYTVLGYFFTKDTKELYTKNRTVVVEKTTSPKVRLFFYPQVYEYELPLISDEDNDFFSTNMLYLIQKKGNNYKIYNLIGYNEPKEFSDGLPAYINRDTIEDFEFLNDTLLIFQNIQSEKIVGINLKENSALIENVSSCNNSYNVSLTKHNIPGSNNENVTAKFKIKVKVWFFQKKFLKFHLETTFLFTITTTTQFHSFHLIQV